MNWALSLIGLLLCAAAFAEQPPAFDEEKIVKAMHAYVRTIDEPLTLFHWDKENSPYVKGFKISQPGGAEKLLKAQAESFLESNVEHGFYLATDPLVSRGYGGKDDRGFLLMQVTLPAGMKYLYIDYPFQFTEKMKHLLGERCARTFANAISVKWEKNECSELKKRVFQRLEVEALRYHWDSPGIHEVCPELDEGAYVITGTKWFKPGLLKTFTYKSRGDSIDRKRIQEISYHATKKYVPKQKPIWPDIPVDAPLSEDTRGWMNSHLLNCRKAKASQVVEDKDPAGEPAADDEDQGSAPAN